MMKCVDLFAGCGGLSLGLINAGIDVVAAIDNWEKAIDVYNKNFDHPCYMHDLTDEEGCLEIIHKYKPDMLVGGPPCQDFSSAGKRDESLGRADLTYHYANIISSYKPKWFVMENVERIKKSGILRDVIEQLMENGYGLSSVVLDASFCGAPQARKRFFLIGELGGAHNQLQHIYQKNMSSQPMSIREYLGDRLGVDYYYRHPRNYSRRGIFSVDEPSPTVRGVNRPLPSGYKKHNADPQEASLKLVRPLTTVERSYLQTFPFDFIWEGSKTNLEQMIGNAVPVKLAEFVAKGILEYINAKEESKIIEGADLFGCTEFILPERALKKATG